MDPSSACESARAVARTWWLLWARCPGVGWRALEQLSVQPGGLQGAWNASREDLESLPGWGRRRAEQVDRYRRRCGADPLASWQRCKVVSEQAAAREPWPVRMASPQGMAEAHTMPALVGTGVLLPLDPAFPPSLRALQRPPTVLFWRGRGSLWPWLRRRQAVAVVGTRRPSPHGLAMARSIGAALARAGWPVVSGLAEGIDGAAHEGCLAAAGHPVAVLGTPLERVYPRHHGPLQQQVATQGLLLSEQFSGVDIKPGHFAARNRLLVALARAVVVVECPLRSGALHSAALAWEQGQPLWAVPADAGKASALGSNRLLSSWASPLLDPADLLRQLGPGPLQRPAGPTGKAPKLEAVAGQDPVLRAAVGQGASLEQLCLQLGEPPAVLAARLLALELAGELRAAPGSCWRPA